MKILPINIQFFYTVKQGQAKILQCLGSNTSISIPEKIQGIPVTEIGAYGFTSTSSFTECLEDADVKTVTHETYVLVSEPMELEEQIASWKENQQGSLLKNIVLPPTVSILGEGAFSNCHGLKHINLPESIDTIADYTFSHCENLKQIHLSKNIQKIGKYAFQNCRNLEDIQLPDGLLSIGDYAFYNCRNLWQINLPQNLCEIGCGMFKNCESLTHINRYGHTFLQDILADMSHQITLTLRYPTETKEKWDVVTLLFPDYEYEFVENHPARVFTQVNYGSGYLYHQCISSSDVDFKRYDELFSLAKREDTNGTIVGIALNRLRYPYRLFDEPRKGYLAYLDRNLIAVAKILIETNDLENLKFITSLGIVTEDRIDTIIDFASLDKKVESLSFLLDYKHTHFSRKERTFEL